VIILARARWCPVTAVAAALLASAGCGGSDKNPLYPAEGRLLVDAKPAAGAVVFLYGDDAGEKAAARPHGIVGPDGTFRLSTYRPDDGVAAGKYRVAVFWTKRSDLGGDDGDTLLPMEYSNPDTSGIPPVVIQEGANELPTIVLNR
jgi:hypothetical protein